MDPKAPIFNIATYGIVEDLHKFLPMLIEKLEIFSSSLIPTYHPAACIYKPAWKKTFLDDLKMVRDELGRRK